MSGSKAASRNLAVDTRLTNQHAVHMARRVSATQAKAQFSALLDEVERGEEVEITRHGRLVARIVPARTGRSLMGLMRGTVEQLVSDEELIKPIPEAEFDGWDFIADPDQTSR